MLQKLFLFHCCNSPTFAAPILFWQNHCLKKTAMSGGIKTNYSFKKKLMNHYELMVIFTPVLSDDDFKNAQHRYKKFIEDNQCVVVDSNPWGLKSLAYPVDKKTTGIYWIVEFEAPADFNEKLKIQLLRDENVMRHMITKLDKYAVEYNARKRSGVASSTEKAEA
jgi:small subunit ribosomal protein S6